MEAPQCVWVGEGRAPGGPGRVVAQEEGGRVARGPPPARAHRRRDSGARAGGARADKRAHTSARNGWVRAGRAGAQAGQGVRRGRLGGVRPGQRVHGRVCARLGRCQARGQGPHLRGGGREGGSPVGVAIIPLALP